MKAFCAICGTLSLLSLTQQVRAEDASVFVFSRIYVTPGREAEAEARLSKQLDFVLQSVPGITYRYYKSTKTPGLFVTYEVFPDKATAQKVVKEVLPEFRAKFGAVPEGLLAQPTEIEVVRPLVSQ
jgi:quinol monooxygenase YgiN